MKKLKLVVIGADGMTGREVIRQGHDRGHEMIATERDVTDSIWLPDGVDIKSLDVLEPGFADIFEGADAVISCLGVGNDAATLLDPPPIYERGARNIIAEMKAADVSRLLVISATFVETANRGPLHFKLTVLPALARVFNQMRDMEDVLRASDGIDWTAMRPGWLLDAPATDDWIVRDRAIPSDMIRTRHADLAHLMIDIVEEGSWIAGYPAISRHEPPENSSLSELIKELWD